MVYGNQPTTCRSLLHEQRRFPEVTPEAIHQWFVLDTCMFIKHVHWNKDETTNNCITFIFTIIMTFGIIGGIDYRSGHKNTCHCTSSFLIYWEISRERKVFTFHFIELNWQLATKGRKTWYQICLKKRMKKLNEVHLLQVRDCIKW